LRSVRVLQVHNSYLVTQDELGILIVDQHALHERVMYETLRNRVMRQNLESQRLLVPAVVEAKGSRMDLFEELKPFFERIGIEAEPIGPDQVGIHAFPTFLFERKVDPIDFVNELVDRIEEGHVQIAGASIEESSLHDVLDMMACKAAVKAGDAMQPEELAALLARRDEIERSSACPHGRPTTIRLSLRDLEKQFKRT